MRKALWISLAVLVVAIGAPAVHADEIVVTVATTASGSLDGIAFSNALVTLSVTNNTASVFGGPVIFRLPGSVTVAVAGGGSDTLTDNVQAFVIPSSSEGGFTDSTQASVILASFPTALSDYDLTTSIGPLLSFATAFNAGNAFPTIGGTFDITTAGPFSTFTATVVTPEPSSLLMIGTALFGLAGSVTFRRKRIVN